jgi:hypothetical protein
MSSSAKLITQQSTYLLLAQEALLLTVRVQIIGVVAQFPPQAMSTASIRSTNNQIIQAIAVNIACVGD